MKKKQRGVNTLREELARKKRSLQPYIDEEYQEPMSLSERINQIRKSNSELERILQPCPRCLQLRVNGQDPCIADLPNVRSVVSALMMIARRYYRRRPSRGISETA